MLTQLNIENLLDTEGEGESDTVYSFKNYTIRTQQVNQSTLAEENLKKTRIGKRKKITMKITKVINITRTRKSQENVYVNQRTRVPKIKKT